MPAVGGHQQACAQAAAIVQLDFGPVVVGGDADHLTPIDQVWRRSCLVGLGHRTGPRSAPDVVIAHKKTQLRLAAMLMPDAHAGLAPTGCAVHDQGVPQRGDVVGPDQAPQAQLLHQGPAVMGEGDLAAVKRWLGQRLALLAVDQGYRQAAAAQGPGQAKTGRSGPGDDDVVVHGAATVGRLTSIGLDSGQAG